MATYSFQSVTATIVGPGGSIQIGNGSGAAEEGISTAMTEEKNTMTIGADGAVMHSLHAGNSGKITVRLLKTSPVNALLNAMYNFQKAAVAAWGQNLITVTDPSRGDVVTSTLVAFAKQPDLTYSKDGGMNTWEFHAGTIDELLGAGVPDVNV